MKSTIIGLLMFTFSAAVKSAVVETSTLTIDKIRISDNTGNAYIDPVGQVEVKNSSCSQSSLYAFHKDDELFNQLYSTALAAAAAGKPVKLWLSADTNDCLSGFQRVRVIETDF